MGGRMLKRWMALPLKNKEAITRRHEVVSYLLEHSQELDKIQTNIRRIGDLERLISKVATLKISPREVVQLKNSLEAIVPIKQLSQNSDNPSLALLGEQLELCEDLRSKIKQTLDEQAPVHIIKRECYCPWV